MNQGDHEHLAFEEYAKTAGLSRDMHPLFLLYLDEETADQLDVFKRGYREGQVGSKLREVDPSFTAAFTAGYRAGSELVGRAPASDSKVEGLYE